MTRKAAWIGIALAAPAASLGVAAAGFVWPGPRGNLVYGLCKGVLYLTPLVWWKLALRAPYPIGRPARGALREGVLLGLGLGGAVLLGWWLLGRHLVDPALLRGVAARAGFDTRERFLVVATLICLGNALLEEYAFRWFLYERCRTLFGPVRGALLGALIFTAHHVIVLSLYVDVGLVVLGSVGVFVAGLIWTWIYERRRSIWPGYVSHVLADVALMIVGWTILFGG